jgi:hypothetical protein
LQIWVSGGEKHPNMLMPMLMLSWWQAAMSCNRKQQLLVAPLLSVNAHQWIIKNQFDLQTLASSPVGVQAIPSTAAMCMHNPCSSTAGTQNLTP